MTNDPRETQPVHIARPLGGFERLYHRFQEKYSLHHTIVSEMNTRVDQAALQDALMKVQQRHPLIATRVEETSDGPVFATNDPPTTVAVRMVEEVDGRTWLDVNAEEMAQPFDARKGARIRATLVQGEERSTVILAVDHRVIDGMAATFVLQDLVAALNGRMLVARAVPSPQEDFIGSLVGSPPRAVDPAITDELPPLPTLDRAGMRPRDGSRPVVTALPLGADATDRLIKRARLEGTTVHGAVVAAGVGALAGARGMSAVRTLTPFDLRPLLGTGPDVVDHHTATITVSTDADRALFWDLARATTTELTEARSAAGVVAGSQAIQQYIRPDGGIDTAVDFLGLLGFDLSVSNVKVLEIPEEFKIRPAAVWGPTLLCQIRGETMIGVTTYDGVLRMINVSHEPIGGYLEDVAQRLANACN